MGKGDKKSRRGKINIGSYGVSRPRRSKSDAVIATSTKKEGETKVKK